jgi:transposase
MFVRGSKGYLSLMCGSCMEATGTYGEALATYSHEAALVVSIVNPAKFKAYAGCADQSHRRLAADQAQSGWLFRDVPA